METVLKIDSAEGRTLAGNLAQLTRETVATAVTSAIRQRLEHEREKAAKVKQLRELAAEISAHMREPVSSNHSWLYDENGLPK